LKTRCFHFSVWTDFAF